MEAKILEFLKNKQPHLCVISTVASDGKPESALMAYAVYDESSLAIVLSTRSDSRKWKNLQINQNLSLVFGSGFKESTVQFEGRAELFNNPNDYKILADVYFEQNPETLQFRGIPELVFIKVKPHWVRYTNYIVNPPDIEEKTYER